MSNSVVVIKKINKNRGRDENKYKFNRSSYNIFNNIFAITNITISTFGVKIHYNEKNKEYHMVPHYDGKDRDKK